MNLAFVRKVIYTHCNELETSLSKLAPQVEENSACLQEMKALKKYMHELEDAERWLRERECSADALRKQLLAMCASVRTTSLPYTAKVQPGVQLGEGELGGPQMEPIGQGAPQVSAPEATGVSEATGAARGPERGAEEVTLPGQVDPSEALHRARMHLEHGKSLECTCNTYSTQVLCPLLEEVQRFLERTDGVAGAGAGADGAGEGAGAGAAHTKHFLRTYLQSLKQMLHSLPIRRDALIAALDANRENSLFAIHYLLVLLYDLKLLLNMYIFSNYI